MTAEPQQEYLRRAVVQRWLEPQGISMKEIDKLRAAKMLQVVKLSPNGHGYFLKREIIAKVLQPFHAAEASAGVRTQRPTNN